MGRWRSRGSALTRSHDSRGTCGRSTEPSRGQSALAVNGRCTQTVLADDQNVASGGPTASTAEGFTTANGRLSSTEKTLNVSYTYRRLPNEQDVVEVTMQIPF